jgi:hypothetical protein
VSAPRQLLTLNGYIPQSVVSELLTAIEASLERLGATRVWIDPATHPDLTVMVELPDAVEGYETTRRRGPVEAVS